MKVGLIDVDSKSPNLALMKLSAYHKEAGDEVELALPLFAINYETIYASKVFTWTPMPGLPKRAYLGGPGFNQPSILPKQINNICPDYDLYGIDYSMGFLTRGCNRKCSWCIVPDMEGGIRAEHDIELFLRHDRVILMDNNVLASAFGIQQIEKIAGLGIKADFNQGLDARLIDRSTARLLARIKWTRCIRIACDYDAMFLPVKQAVENLRIAGYLGEIFCYVLVKDVGSALERVGALREIGVEPFAQPYRPASGKRASVEIRRFARWVNHKAMFKSVTWEELEA